ALRGSPPDAVRATKTLNPADAAEHLIGNPLWPLPHADTAAEDRQRLVTTALLLVLLGALFLRGFKEAIGIAAVLVGAYLTLTAVVVGAGLIHLLAHPGAFGQWLDRVRAGQWFLAHRPVAGTGAGAVALMSLLLFPSLALGLSGFETGVAVMPLIRGERVRNTRKLLLTAAVIMSLYLLGSAIVVCALIEPAALVNHDAAGQPV